MRNVAVLATQDSRDHQKLCDHTLAAFASLGYTTRLYPNGSKHVYLDTGDLMHIARLVNPGKANYESTSMVNITALLFGVIELTEWADAQEAMIEILALPNFKRLIVRSIDPLSAKLHVWSRPEMRPYMDKIYFTHELPYDDPALYDVNKWDARDRLLLTDGINPVALFFGGMSFAKGGSQLYRAAVNLPQIHFYYVGSQESSNYGFSQPEMLSAPNVTWVDMRVTDEEAALWFRASDIIVLPYTNKYKHDTSQVMIQAMQAHRPVVAPNFSPFSDAVLKYGIGQCFIDGDVYSLAKTIWSVLEMSTSYLGEGGDRYLANCGSWTDGLEVIDGLQQTAA